MIFKYYEIEACKDFTHLLDLLMRDIYLYIK